MAKSSVLSDFLTSRCRFQLVTEESVREYLEWKRYYKGWSYEAPCSYCPHKIRWAIGGECIKPFKAVFGFICEMGFETVEGDGNVHNCFLQFRQQARPLMSNVKERLLKRIILKEIALGITHMDDHGNMYKKIPSSLYRQLLTITNGSKELLVKYYMLIHS